VSRKHLTSYSHAAECVVILGAFLLAQLLLSVCIFGIFDVFYCPAGETGAKLQLFDVLAFFSQ